MACPKQLQMPCPKQFQPLADQIYDKLMQKKPHEIQKGYKIFAVVISSNTE